MRNKPFFARSLTHGFTLLELMVTVAIVAILAALALPSFTEMNIRMSVTTNTNGLVAALNLARSEAVKRGANVSVASTSGSSSWTTGWSVKTATETLRTYPALTGNYSVATAAGAGGDPKEIVFSARGDLGTVIDSFDFFVCRPDHNPANSRDIHVGGSGVITTKTGASSCL